MKNQSGKKPERESSVATMLQCTRVISFTPLLLIPLDLEKNSPREQDASRGHCIYSFSIVNTASALRAFPRRRYFIRNPPSGKLEYNVIRRARADRGKGAPPADSSLSRSRARRKFAERGGGGEKKTLTAAGVISDSENSSSTRARARARVFLPRVDFLFFLILLCSRVVFACDARLLEALEELFTPAG